MPYPQNIQNLINKLSKLPTIGPKTAERIVIHLLSRPSQIFKEIGEAFLGLSGKIATCSICCNYTDIDPCAICKDPRRDTATICVVAKPQDVQIIEKTNSFHGLYHILGGTVNPLEGIRIEQLNSQKLIERMKKNNIQEIILALNPDIEGESTILSLKRFLEPFKVKLTRLARGLPMGSDIEYADEVTLADALKGRKDV